MEKAIQQITQIFDQFFKEEFGNRLSQFAFITLKSSILDELKKVDLNGKTEKVSD